MSKVQAASGGLFFIKMGPECLLSLISFLKIIKTHNLETKAIDICRLLIK